MDDAVLVRIFKRLGNLSGDGDRFIHGNGAPLQSLRKVFALDEFEDKREGISLFESVDRGDVWMIEGREQLSFTLEPRDPFVILREGRGQYLDRNIAIQFCVVRAKHFAHPARTNGTDDFVGA